MCFAVPHNITLLAPYVAAHAVGENHYPCSTGPIEYKAAITRHVEHVGHTPDVALNDPCCDLNILPPLGNRIPKEVAAQAGQWSCCALLELDDLGIRPAGASHYGGSDDRVPRSAGWQPVEPAVIGGWIAKGFVGNKARQICKGVRIRAFGVERR